MIGSAVYQWLTERGHSVTRLVRPSLLKKSVPGCIFWNPYKKTIDLEALEGHDALIHLAGAGIADHRWTSSYKKLILESRVESTEFLAQSLRRLKRPPQKFFSASAIGYYGHRGANDILDETGVNGHGFLAQVTKSWEQANLPAQAFGINVVHMRFGMVLDRRAGALSKMLPAFYLGLGGPIGLGRQIISWIALLEIPQMIYFLTIKNGTKGPVNFTAPTPVTNREFAQTLGSVIKRPAVLPFPGFAVRGLLGEMGQELLLNGAYVVPRRMLDKGYRFSYPDLRSALVSILK